MTHMNNNKNNNRHHLIAATATISVLALAIIILASTSIASPVAATTTNTTTTAGNTTTSTTSSASSSGIKLSSQPIYQEQIKDTGNTPLDQTHIRINYAGNGTLNLPNATEAIRTTSTATGIAPIVGNDFEGKELLTTVDGSDSATVRIHGLFRFNEQGRGEGIIIAVFNTNSTGKLAPLDGMIVAGTAELHPEDASGLVRVWEWHSAIPYIKMPTQSMTQEQQSPPANATTATNELPPPSSSPSSSPLTGP